MKQMLLRIHVVYIQVSLHMQDRVDIREYTETVNLPCEANCIDGM